MIHERINNLIKDPEIAEATKLNILAMECDSDAFNTVKNNSGFLQQLNWEFRDTQYKTDEIPQKSNNSNIVVENNAKIVKSVKQPKKICEIKKNISAKINKIKQDANIKADSDSDNSKKEDNDKNKEDSDLVLEFSNNGFHNNISQNISSNNSNINNGINNNNLNKNEVEQKQICNINDLNDTDELNNNSEMFDPSDNNMQNKIPETQTKKQTNKPSEKKETKPKPKKIKLENPKSNEVSKASTKVSTKKSPKSVKAPKKSFSKGNGVIEVPVYTDGNILIILLYTYI